MKVMVEVETKVMWPDSVKSVMADAAIKRVDLNALTESEVMAYEREGRRRRQKYLESPRVQIMMRRRG